MYSFSRTLHYTFVTWNTVHCMIELHIDSTTKFLLMVSIICMHEKASHSIIYMLNHFNYTLNSFLIDPQRNESIQSEAANPLGEEYADTLIDLSIYLSIYLSMYLPSISVTSPPLFVK